MNRLALPFIRLRYSLPERRSQAIYISNIVSIDCPSFCFFLWIRRFTINSNTDTLPVREKFFFDTRHLFPTYCYYFPTLTAFNQYLWPNLNRKWNGSNDTQVDDKTHNKQNGDNCTAYRRHTVVDSNPYKQGGYTQHA